MSVTSTVSIFYHRHRIWKVVTMLDIVVEKFRGIQIYPNFKRYMIINAGFAVMSLVFIFVGLLFMAVWLGFSEKVGILMICGYLSSSYSTSMAWKSMFHQAIFLRLQLINDTVECSSCSFKYPIISCRSSYLTNSKLTTRTVSISAKETEATILVLKSIHHDLMKCVWLMNVVFGFQTMLCIGITFLFTLFTFFSAYKTFYFYDYTIINITLSILYWCFFYNLFKVTIVFTCNFVDSETEELATLIY